MSDRLRVGWEGKSLLAQELGAFSFPKRSNFSLFEVSPRLLQARWAPWRRRQTDPEAAGADVGRRAGRGTP